MPDAFSRFSANGPQAKKIYLELDALFMTSLIKISPEFAAKVL